MPKSFISINGKKIDIGYKLLDIIAKELPIDAAYDELGKAIFDLHIPSLCETLLPYECITIDQLDELWATNDIALQKILLKEDSFFYHLTDEQAKDLIKINDKEMLLALAENFYKILPTPLYDDDDEDEDEDEDVIDVGEDTDTVFDPLDDYDDEDEQGDRISEDSIIKLENFLANHDDVEIQITFARHKYLPDFTPSIDELIDYTLKTGKLFPTDYIDEEDIEDIAHAPAKILALLGANIEEIEDTTMQLRIATIIAGHPDPEVRLALAENDLASEEVLRILEKDSDIDVRNAARDSIYADFDDDDE